MGIWDMSIGGPPILTGGSCCIEGGLKGRLNKPGSRSLGIAPRPRVMFLSSAIAFK